MAETKKITKREVINELLKEDLIQNTPMYKNYLEHELELLDRKNSGSAQTKTQKENEVVCEMLVNELVKVAQPITITDLMATSETIKDYVLENGNHLTNQKISALLKQLVESNKVVRTVNKKRTYFSVEG